MLVSEKELSVEVAKVNGIQVYDVYFAKASEGQILQQLTANTSCPDHENPSLLNLSVSDQYDQEVQTESHYAVFERTIP
jgi:hypothetical protein